MGVVNSINFVVQEAQICVKIVPFYNVGAVERNSSGQYVAKRAKLTA